MSDIKAMHDASHDFDFLFGDWRIENTRLLKRLESCTESETFHATGHAEPVLSGVGNIDDFVPEGWRPGFLGMTLRLFNLQTGRWSIYWASNATGSLEPPVVGGFNDGVGIFEGDDELNGRPVRVRFVWSEITAHSARWEQMFSGDGGTTWETNWIMRFTRTTD
jgi:hypothetical protein